MTDTAPTRPEPVVTAVLVAHDGAAWLPRTLGALRAQTRAPDVVVGVDTGSTDESAELLAAQLAQVLRCPRDTGFGAAVAAGLAAAEETRTLSPAGESQHWVWLLHDDVEPDPAALAELLAEAERAGPGSPVAVLGPKVRGWYDRRLLLEVGVTIARSGRRETLLERREQDQGQHDGVRQALAVSTAGMLVRADVWAELGGLDPDLPLMRDDVDLGWRATLAGYEVRCVTDAVVYHAEAAAHARRPVQVPGSGGHVGRLDRRNAARVLLLNLPWYELPVTALRLVLGGLLRAAGLLLGKAPVSALDELLAVTSALARPDRILAGRARRRRTRRRSARAAHSLLAPRGSGWRHLMETVNLLVGPGPAAAAGGAHRAVETGPVAEETEELPSWGSSVAARLLTRPGILLVAGLVLVAAVADRSLFGSGRLMGGALLPAPGSAGDLWRTYVEAWHPVGLGSGTDSPPYLAVLAMVGTVLLGHATWAVDLLVLAAVPLAATTAYVALRRLVPSVPLRLWAATTYALLPPVVGAVAAGRLSTLAVAVLLPVTAMVAARTLDGPGRPGSVRAAWGAGLLLAVMSAFAPMVYLLALVLLAVTAVLLARGRALARLGVVAVVPPLLLLPWLPALARDPELLVREAGLPGPGLADPHLPAAALVLLHPGGPGMYPMVLTVGLLLAALAALLRPSHRALVLAGWVTALVGIVAALVQSRLTVTAPTVQLGAPAWTGPALLVAGAGLLVAAVAGAGGSRALLAERSFGWRQPTAVVVTALAALTPVVAAGWWLVDGAGDPLDRRDPVLLPAFIAAEGSQPDRPRTLVLRPRGAHALAFVVLRESGPRLGDAETSTAERTGLGRVVADLASGRGGDAAAGLLPYGVRYVLLTGRLNRSLAPDVDVLAQEIDKVPGLGRVSGPSGSLVWRVQYPTGRLRVVDDPGRARSAPGIDATVLPAGPVGARTEVASGPSGRLLTVAERADGGWRATVAGKELPRTTYDRWAQGFRLPPDGGPLELRYDAGRRPALLWTQAGLLLLVVVLVLPAVRREETPDAGPGAAGTAGGERTAEPVAVGTRRRR